QARLSSPQRLDLRTVRYRKPPLPQQLRVLTDHLEPRADGPSRQEAPVHVLQDYSQLKVRQHGVKVETAEVVPALFLVARRRLFPRREPIQRHHRRAAYRDLF